MHIIIHIFANYNTTHDWNESDDFLQVITQFVNN